MDGDGIHFPTYFSLETFWPCAGFGFSSIIFHRFLYIPFVSFVVSSISIYECINISKGEGTGQIYPGILLSNAIHPNPTVCATCLRGKKRKSKFLVCIKEGTGRFDVDVFE